MRPLLSLLISVLLVAGAAKLLVSQIPFDMPVHSRGSAPHTEGASADVQSPAPSTSLEVSSAKPVRQGSPSRAAFALFGPVSPLGGGELNWNQPSLGPRTLIMSPGLEDRGISVRGAHGPNNLLDGRIADDRPENDHTGEGMKLPIKSGARLQNGRPAIFDVSEGTALDPLQDKSWDLNSSKLVPVAQNEPGDNHGNPPVSIAAPRKAPNPKKKSQKWQQEPASQRKHDEAE
jgi:hypothetical protein